MGVDLQKHLAEYSEAIDAYDNPRAFEIVKANSLIERVKAEGATSRDSALIAGRWSYWVSTSAGGEHIARMPAKVITISVFLRQFRLHEKVNPYRYVTEMSAHLRGCNNRPVSELIASLKDFYFQPPPEMDDEVKALICNLERFDPETLAYIEIS